MSFLPRKKNHCIYAHLFHSKAATATTHKRSLKVGWQQHRKKNVKKIDGWWEEEEKKNVSSSFF